ncbi:MAG TPA: XRE family transcriptional regulator [Bacteroidetes bacterium]|nr:XRE family transcriptional regulator [Bacteroidota bacterium]
MIDCNYDPSNFNLAQNLRALRKRKKWSQEELAERLGLNRGNIASYESGTAEPKICNLVKIARLFKISIFDLTHNDLKEEATYIRATQAHENGSFNPKFPAIGQYAVEAKDFETAIKGLECIFKMKLRDVGEIPEEMAFFKEQFLQLCGVSRHLLKSHLELIATVKSNCNEHKNGALENAVQEKVFNA